MSARSAWVGDHNAALLTDLYELTMLQAYWREGMHDEAVFTLFSRRLPAGRNFLLACGLEDVLHYLETVRFPAEALEYLATVGPFTDPFLDWLAGFRSPVPSTPCPRALPSLPRSRSSRWWRRCPRRSWRRRSS